MLQNGTLAGVANAWLVIIEKVKICLNRKAFIFLLWITRLAVLPTHLFHHLHPVRCSSFSCNVEPDTHSTWRCRQVVRLRAQPQMLHKWILSMAHEVEIPLSGSQRAHLLFLHSSSSGATARQRMTDSHSIFGMWESNLWNTAPGRRPSALTVCLFRQTPWTGQEFQGLISAGLKVSSLFASNPHLPSSNALSVLIRSQEGQ